MKIRLTLAQVTALIDKAEQQTVLDLNLIEGGLEEKPIGGISPKLALRQAIVILKNAVDTELQDAAGRVDLMMLDLQQQGYTEVAEDLEKVKIRVDFLNGKTKNKYFDEEGNIKEE
tara:strand:- start:622 stop:969 length:348 start_codon:yes stop_codon:yes gene_type:complete